MAKRPGRPRLSRVALISIVVSLALLGVACSDDDPEQGPEASSTSPGTAEGSPSPSSTAECAEQLDKILGPDGLTAEPLDERKGDIDGDGSDDRVWVAQVVEAPPGCGFFVGADLAGGPVTAMTERNGVAFSRPPRINSLVDVNGDGELEIVLDLEGGASTQFVGMFQFAEGTLLPVGIEEDTTSSGLMPYGGSVGHLEASDCAPSGEGDVVVSTAVPKGDRYEVTRTFYVLTDGFLFLSGKPQVTTADADEVVGGRFPEYSSSPFGSCGS